MPIEKTALFTMAIEKKQKVIFTLDWMYIAGW